MSETPINPVATENKALSIFGVDSVGDPHSKITKLVGNIIRSEVAWRAIDQVAGAWNQPRKISSLWEQYLPEPLTATTLKAVQAIRTNDDYSWERFLALEPIKEALADDVIYKWVEDLHDARSFIRREKFLVDGEIPEDATKEEKEQMQKYTGAIFKKAEPGLYSLASSSSEAYVNRVVPTTERVIGNREGIAAMYLARMSAFRKLAAHFLGAEEFVNSGDLGGATYFGRKIKSDAIERDKADPRMKNSLRTLRIGHVKSATYDAPEKRQFRPLLEAVFKECSMQPVNGKVNWENPVQQLTSVICPFLAMTPDKFRQKNLPVSTAYSLFKAAEGLRMLDSASIYPLLGTGMQPNAELPPDFVERFDPEWRKSQRLPLAVLQHVGFPVIVHKDVKSMVAKIREMVPDFTRHLQQEGVFEELKNARTSMVFVEPIRQIETKRMLWRSFRGYNPAEATAFEKSMESDMELLNLTDSPREQTWRKAEKFADFALKKYREDTPQAISHLEKTLLGDKVQEVYDVTLPSELIWASDLKAKYVAPSPKVEQHLSP